jgi:1,4-dihydroxy-2-naphthoyl-CoA synthase
MITLDVADRVATITLNDPSRRNIVSAALNAAVIEGMNELESRSDVGAIVVTGAAPAFCAGADLDDLAACDSEEKLRTIYSGFLRLAESPLPTIAAVNGAAVGAGLNLALACDVILAGASARFDTRFLQIGLHPGGGNTWRLRRITDLQTTMALVLFGEVVDGQQAAFPSKQQIVQTMAFFADQNDRRHGLLGVVQVPGHLEGDCKTGQLAAQIGLAHLVAGKLHAHEKQAGIVVVVLGGLFNVAAAL